MARDLIEPTLFSLLIAQALVTFVMSQLRDRRYLPLELATTLLQINSGLSENDTLCGFGHIAVPSPADELTVSFACPVLVGVSEPIMNVRIGIPFRIAKLF